MPVTFILGAAGSGKSTLLIRRAAARAAAAPQEHHVLLVPEQFTFETQRRLVREHPRHAFLNIQAISFAHLAARVFREQSARDLDVLSETAKQMLICLALRDAEPKLGVYRRQAGRASFAAGLGSLFAEWDMNGITPERIAQISENETLTPLLRGKLHDMAAVFAAFKARLGEKQMTAQERLPRLRRFLPESPLLRGAHLYLDGFTGFTAVQYDIIGQLMERCPETVIALTLPRGENPWRRTQPGDLFYMTREVIRKIQALAEGLGQEVRAVWAEGGVGRPEDLSFLEKHLLRGGSRETFAGEPSAITLVTGADVRAECDGAAARILSLVRGEGLRYREIAVVLGDTETYLPVLERRLAEAGVPFFSDRRESVRHHPLVRLIEAAVEAAVKNLPRESVLRFLKNSCGPLEAEETDILETYVLAAGVRRGTSWEGPFTRAPRRTAIDPAQAEALRARGLAPLLALQKALRRPAPVPAFNRALREMLGSPDIAARLARAGLPGFGSGQEPEAEAAGEERDAAETAAVAEAVAQLLDDMDRFLKDAVMSGEDYAQLVRFGLDSLTLGRIPSRFDQVVLGDVERSRYGDIRALLFLGLNEGLIPHGQGGGPLLTDPERRRLEEIQPELGYTAERAVFEELFYLYGLFAKPTQSLYLSRHRLDADGRAAQPSPLIAEIRSLFPDLKETALEAASPVERICDKKSAVRELALAIRRDGLSRCRALYRAVAGDPSLAEDLRRIEEGRFWRFPAHILSEEAAAGLTRGFLTGSISRLETYAACPYHYYLENMLRLKPREEWTFRRSDFGSMMHAMMEKLLGEVSRQQIALSALSEEERSRMIAAALKEYLNDPSTVLPDGAAAAYLTQRWQGALERELAAMARFEGENGYRPLWLERRFSGRELPELYFRYPEGRMELTGVIDRVDLAGWEDKKLLRIVDYKTGSRDRQELDMTKLWHGLQLQLPTYLEAAMALVRRELPGETVLRGAMCYAPLTDAFTRVKAWEKSGDAESILLDSRQMKGVNSEEFPAPGGDGEYKPYSVRILEAMSRHCLSRIREFGDRILKGEIPLSPVRCRDLDACRYCEFAAVCRFDVRLGAEAREIPAEEEVSVRERLLAEADAEKEAGRETD